MTETIAGITVPDTELARAATELVREATDDNVFHHSRRVFFFGMIKAAHQGKQVDPELAYVGGMFHDLGLTPGYRTTERRFEVDGAQAAYDFLREHGRSEEEARAVWFAIALHTTPGIPNHLSPRSRSSPSASSPTCSASTSTRSPRSSARRSSPPTRAPTSRTASCTPSTTR
ncbi:HD domain-containing protein [Mobilicoccus caccae]|uniref:HD domain-containing protein n=1 Tax=Mobilicoccus caccae TaxID=1859295 RepID=A0ABQ6IMJ7_9MICO|nr:HD domain-containing protein [Mobilicoccus caccae]GMA39143.1 hypothetical protein GCM10025883_11880 [Mobilicoccus caccae]